VNFAVIDIQTFLHPPLLTENNIMKRFALALVCVFFASTLQAQAFKVGTVQVDITPPKAVALDGQMHTRISQKVTTPLTANVLAMEGVLENQNSSAVFVSFDLVAVRRVLDKAVRDAVKKALPDFDVQNLILCGTHTHTAPVTEDDKYFVPAGTDYMKPSEYVVFAAEKVAVAVAEAWKNRQPAKFGYGLGYGVVAYNRRAVYADGKGVMYGNTNQPTFRRIEGMEDHDIGTLFFWDNSDKLLAMLVNVSCPTQEVEGLSEVHADFWHPARAALKAKYGNDVLIVPAVGAGGDISPRPLYRRAAEDRMRNLRKLSRIEEIARRIANAVDESYEVAKNDKKTDVPFRHEYAVLQLPKHKITAAEYEAAKKVVADYQKRAETDPGVQRLLAWNSGVLTKYENLQKEPDAKQPIPVHVLRIGDTAVMTNPFEFFTAYGVQLKARCKAVQTFVVQLTDACPTGSAGYLPTAEAYQHGGYSAIPQSVVIGPEGGQVLVEETLKISDGMFVK